jgi:transcriptional regulator with XRE-family HTH domain
MSEPTAANERIQDEREWLGFSRAQVAAKLGLSEATIEAFEDGAQAPSDDELAKLARLFRLAPERLRGEPLAEDPVMAIACGKRDITAEDRYQVMRFAEFLRHAGPVPATTPDAPTEETETDG